MPTVPPATARSRSDTIVTTNNFFNLPTEYPEQAVGPLGAYLSVHGLAGMPGRAVVSQGEMIGRPSFLHLEVAPAGDSWAIDVGGAVQLVGEGSFSL